MALSDRVNPNDGTGGVPARRKLSSARVILALVEPMSVNNESEWLGSLISSVPESQLWTETMAVLALSEHRECSRCVDSIVPVYFAAQKVHGVDRHLVLGIQMFRQRDFFSLAT